MRGSQSLKFLCPLAAVVWSSFSPLARAQDVSDVPAEADTVEAGEAPAEAYAETAAEAGEAQAAAPGEAYVDEGQDEAAAPAPDGFVAEAAVSSADLGAGSTGQDRQGLSYELGIFVGYEFFARDLELGVPDAPGFSSAPDFGPVLGLRLAINWLPWLAVEAEGAMMPTRDRWDDLKVTIGSYKLHLLAHLWNFKLGRYGLRPFALAGVGLMQVISTEGGPGRGIERKDIDGESHFGGGVKFDINDWFALRYDTRILIRPNTRHREHSPNWELLLGASFKFGGAPPAPPAPPPPLDSDGDGIVDPEDQCPTEPEDFDGHQDEDGCPDFDNDGDGIADADDRCPGDPETFNGIEDEDGCPESDGDGDSILDAQDQCPTEPEDFDGHQDEDGCPDSDNDGDGIADADDQCPGNPENMNGFQDEDGCPDEVPVEVQKYTGVIKGIQFKKNSSSIESSSMKMLGEAVEVLKTHQAVRLLIEGHSSSEGSDALNMTLSQRRADSVREYLISAGIDVSRLEAKGLGSERPIAPNATRKGREQNRRIEFKLIQK